MHDASNPYDVHFRRLGNYQKVLYELVRLSLPSLLFALIDPACVLQVLNPRIAGFGEADLVVLAPLRDGRYMLIVWEHKSYRSRRAQMQLVSYVFGKARELVQDEKVPEGKTPIMCGVFALHREASKYPPEDLADLAGLSEEERKVTLNSLSISKLDFGKINLEDLCEDPEAGGPILPMTVGWNGRELGAKDLAYLAKAVVLHKEDMRHYYEALYCGPSTWRAGRTDDSVADGSGRRAEARGDGGGHGRNCRAAEKRGSRRRPCREPAAVISAGG